MCLFNKTKYTKLERRGYQIVLPTKVYEDLHNDGYRIGLVVRDNSKTVQLTKNGKYCGTLKAAMGVSSFKNGNPCDFHKSNLRYE